jgi:hypothetical protein
MSEPSCSATSAYSAPSARTHCCDGMRSDIWFFRAEGAEIAESAEKGKGL